MNKHSLSPAIVSSPSSMGLRVTTSSASGGNSLAPSRTQKERGELAIEFADKLLTALGPGKNRNAIDLERIYENYELYEGRWSALAKAAPNYQIKVADETISFARGAIRHYPLVDRPAKSIVGDIAASSLEVNVRDHTRQGARLRERMQAERTAAMLGQVFIAPLQEKIRMQVMAEMGVANPELLSEEENAMMANRLAEAMQNQIPSDWEDELQNVKTPLETIAETLAKAIVRDSNFRENYIKGGIDAVANAEEYYRLRFVNGQIKIDHCTLPHTSWFGGSNCQKAQDALVATTYDYLTPQDLVAKYGGLLDFEGIENLEDLYTPYSRDQYHLSEVKRSEKQDFGSRVISEHERNIARQANLYGIDQNTKEGFNMLKSLMAAMPMSTGNSIYGIIEEYITWRWLRPMKAVYRRTALGTVECYYEDEHYVTNPMTDLEVYDIMAPEVWEATRVAGKFWHQVRPVVFQYRNINNPFDVKLTIYGNRYNDGNGTTAPVSAVDKGKVWNLRYNVLMRRMEEDEQLDLGMIAQFSEESTPTGWTFTELVRSVVQSKTVLVKSKDPSETNTPALSAVNLSRHNEIEANIAKLQYAETMVTKSMYASDEMLGATSQYQTDKNAQLNLTATDRMSRAFHVKRRMLIQEVLQDAMQLAIRIAPEHTNAIEHLLTDKEISFLVANIEDIQKADLRVLVIDSNVDNRNLELAKQNVATMVQQAGISSLEILEVWNATTMNELMEIARKLQRKIEKQQVAASQSENQKLKDERDFVMMKYERELADKRKDAALQHTRELERASIFASQQERANDVNRDGINDANERAQQDRIHEAVQNELDRRHELATIRAKQEAEFIAEGIKLDANQQKALIDADNKLKLKQMDKEIASQKNSSKS